MNSPYTWFLLAIVLAGCGDSLRLYSETSTEDCPSASCIEVCDDGIDNDLDTYVDCADLDCEEICITDLDDDGFDGAEFGGDDCDDTNPDVYPGAAEVCDGLDNDCDSLVDQDDDDLDLTTLLEWYPDQDNDGYGQDGPALVACTQPGGAAADNTDCDDTEASTNPGATDVPGDCIDNDCDGVHGDLDCEAMLYLVRQTDDMLRTLDPSSLVFTDVGLLGVNFEFGELAWDATSGTLYMVDGRAGTNLYTVDTTTGSATLVGSHGIEGMFGLAFSPTGALYGSLTYPGGVYLLDPTTAAATWVGQSRPAQGLTWDADRNYLVATYADIGDLHQIDPLTGMSVQLTNQGALSDGGIAWDADRDLYWVIDQSGNLYSYDPNALYARTTQLSGLEPHDGLTFGP